MSTKASASKPRSRRGRAAVPDAGPTPPAEKATESVAEKPGPSLGSLAAFSTDARTLAVNVTILIAIVLIVPVVLTQFMRDKVLIDPLAVPEALQQTGLTPEIAGRRLWDGINEVKQIAGSSKISVDAIPDSQDVTFSIPDAGLSIDSLIYYVRRFFNIHETHIGGEFRCGDPACTPEKAHLRLRIVRDDVEIRQLGPVGDRSEGAYFVEAATEVLGVVDPFIAIAARSVSQPARARALAQQLVASKHPDAKWAHNLIGNLLLDEGKVSAALSEYQAALAIDPNFTVARSNLGNAHYILGADEPARQAFDAALAADPNSAHALRGLAKLAVRRGEPDLAIELLLKAAETAFPSGDYLAEAANIELARGNHAGAIDLWSRALEVEPNNRLALVQMALQMYSQERFADAEQLYRAAADFSPDDPELLADHADILILVQDFHAAMERVDQALAIEPGRPRYHILKASALLNLERPEEALESLATAAHIEPDNSDIPFKMASALEALGRHDDAIAAYRRYIELEPQSVMVPVAEAYIALIEKKKVSEAAGSTTEMAAAP